MCTPTTIPTVFIVEDNHAVRAATTSVLEATGFSVQPFVSAEEFLDGYVASRRGCLLLDHHLPGKSGLELQRELAAKKCDLSIILQSGRMTEAIRKETLSIGAVAAMEKPVCASELIALIRSTIDSAK